MFMESGMDNYIFSQHILVQELVLDQYMLGKNIVVHTTLRAIQLEFLEFESGNLLKSDLCYVSGYLLSV